MKMTKVQTDLINRAIRSGNVNLAFKLALLANEEKRPMDKATQTAHNARMPSIKAGTYDFSQTVVAAPKKINICAY
jgi:hypothetical protein